MIQRENTEYRIEYILYGILYFVLIENVVGWGLQIGKEREA